MALISKATLVLAEHDLAEAIRFALEREGTIVSVAASGPLEVDSGTDLVIIGPDGDETAIRAALESVNGTPALCLHNAGDELRGNHPRSVLRARAEYARDVVTLARLVAATKDEQPQSYVGNLSDHFSLISLVRAIGCLGESMVLSLARGLRRGELRFYNGEVTSAQVGMLHGISALHQLLLWTQARFELRREPIVSRQQIPMSPEELWRDATAFLESLRDASPTLSPAITYVSNNSKLITDDIELPSQGQTVLRLFDGMRELADVVEDSPFGVVATLRIANRLDGLGLLSISKQPERSHEPARTALESWLYGETVAARETGEDIDPSAPWTEFEVTENDGEGYSPVVPSAQAMGEIVSRAPEDADQSATAADTSDGAPVAVRRILSGEITSVYAGGPDRRVHPRLPSVVVEGLEVISDDAREAVGLAAVVANVPDAAGDGFEEVTKPGKRVPGFIPGAEAEPVPPIQLGEQVARLVQDASHVAGLARPPLREAEFFRIGAKHWSDQNEPTFDEAYKVSSGFWQRFFGGTGRAGSEPSEE